MMGRTRRYQTRSVGGTSTSSSADDSEHQQTMNIIEKMSKKYLHSQSIQKKKTSTPTTRSQSRSQSQKDKAYEADSEPSTSTSQSDSSIKSVDLYDFEQSDDSLRLVLFPQNESVKLKKKQVKSSKKSRAKENKPSQRKPSVKTGLPVRSLGSNSKMVAATATSKKRKILTPDVREIAGRKKPKPEPGPNVKKDPKSTPSVSVLKKRSQEISLIDSGVFMSPIEKVRVSNMSNQVLTPFLTPNLSMSTSSQLSDSQGYGTFDSLLEPSPALSPVRLAQTKTFGSKQIQPAIPMELDSPKMKTPTADKTYAGQGLFMTPLEKMEKKAKPKTKRVTKTRVDAWANKMNAEFDEIEMYDLSIEDQ